MRNTRFEDVIRAWGHLHSVMRERLEAARTHYTPPALGELIEVDVLDGGDGALPEWRVGKVEALTNLFCLLEATSLPTRLWLPTAAEDAAESAGVVISTDLLCA